MREKRYNLKISTVNTIPSVLPTMPQGTYAAYRVVAVKGQIEDWAAYKGPSDWSDEMICSNGNKIPENAARELFYVFDASGMRYRS
jgi:hypothetical protein